MDPVPLALPLTTLTIASIPTPLGRMLAGADEDALWLLEFAPPGPEGEQQPASLARRLDARLRAGHNALTRRVARELDVYFHGRLREFTVPIRMSGTPFQRRA